ncbi:MAG: PKD domain-containing protein [Chloroflexota bacterium]
MAFNGSGSTGETSYVWDFDDGSTSTAANPSHTFSDARSYSVILTVKGPGGQDQAFKVVNVPC